MKNFLLLISFLSFAACNDSNAGSRNLGGTMRFDIPCNQKLVNVTWKEDDLWYLTRPMNLSDKPSVLVFQEKSHYGMLQGKVIISESHCGE